MENRSPLARAEEAKRRRDLVGEVDALVGGHRALTEAPWYPSRPGDQLLITLEASGTAPRSTELYEVVEGGGNGGGGLELRLVEVAPEGATGGWYAGPPELYGADPVETPWMEAGSDRLTITRDGVIVHQGRHALPRPHTAEPQLTPDAFALSLIRTTALDEAARGADGPPPANWEMHRTLTQALEGWRKDGTLRESSLLLVEWLASELCAYVAGRAGGRARVERWLRDFGDEVCRVQQHAHPAGPTAVAIMSVVAEDLDPRPQDPDGAERLIRIGTLYLRYLRDGHQVEDAREMALTLALWAGSQLAALMLNDPARISAYLNARDHAAPGEGA
ncbi:hypothetical protein ACF1FX_34460 [Streptomyces sp. NPDC014646]|uniref:hypothetical protein n=1 Tax=Streptomyces sp. NPDC014646 TaxID=3364877 RepID=UPI0036F6E66D